MMFNFLNIAKNTMQLLVGFFSNLLIEKKMIKTDYFFFEKSGYVLIKEKKVYSFFVSSLSERHFDLGFQ